MKSIYHNVRVTDVISSQTHVFIADRVPELEESTSTSESGTLFKQEGRLFISEDEIGGIKLSQYLIIEYSLGNSTIIWGDTENPVFANYTHHVSGVQVKMERKSLHPLFR